VRQLIILAFGNLINHARRNIFLGSAIAGVTALMVLLGCFSSGVRNTILNSALSLSTGHIDVNGYYKITSSQTSLLITDFAKVEDVIKKTLPDLDYMTERSLALARVISDEFNRNDGIYGIDPVKEPQLKKVIKIKEGSLDSLAKPGNMLLFENQAKQFKVKIGDMLTCSLLTNRGVNNTVDVRVGAIAKDAGTLVNNNVFLDKETLNQLIQTSDSSTSSIHVYIKDIRNIPRDMELLRKALKNAGYSVMDRESKAFFFKMQDANNEDWTGQKLDLATWDDEISYLTTGINAIDGLNYLLVIILLAIISIGIMNSIWIAIRERTREIGTLRAIGMRKGKVMTMFVLEAFFLGVISTLAGSITGCLIAMVLNIFNLPVPEGAQFFTLSSTIHFSFNFLRILSSALFVTVCCSLIAMIPSYQASKLEPVTALSHFM
jgi:ABC-type lipoprotein release transport system permease subunit